MKDQTTHTLKVGQSVSIDDLKLTLKEIQPMDVYNQVTARIELEYQGRKDMINVQTTDDDGQAYEESVPFLWQGYSIQMQNTDRNKTYESLSFEIELKKKTTVADYLQRENLQRVFNQLIFEKESIDGSGSFEFGDQSVIVQERTIPSAETGHADYIEKSIESYDFFYSLLKIKKSEVRLSFEISGRDPVQGIENHIKALSDYVASREELYTISATHSNVAVLITDFVTNNFEGGIIYHFPKGTSDKLPLEIKYEAPNDFGSIEFKHRPSGKTLFQGEIIRYGSGIISVPKKDLIHADLFSKGESDILYPPPYEYFEFSTEIQSFTNDPHIMIQELEKWGGADFKPYRKEFEESEGSLEQFIDRAWQSVSKTTVVNEFLKQKCSVGFYLYTPATGNFNPMKAKWIIFLHLN